MDQAPSVPAHVVRDNSAIPGYLRAVLVAATLGRDVHWTVRAALDAARDGNIAAFGYMMIRSVRKRPDRHELAEINAVCMSGRNDLFRVVKPVSASPALQGCLPVAFRGVMRKSAAERNIECVELLLDVGIPWDDECMQDAAGAGDVEFIARLRDLGCPWTARACTRAAVVGHLDCLVWLVERGCPLDADDVLSNPRRGNVKCLDYVFDVAGCRWNSTVVDEAIGLDLPDVLDWALGKGLMDPEDDRLAWIAVRKGNLNVIKWLKHNGFAMGHSSEGAYRSNHMKCFMWMARNGCECYPETRERAEQGIAWNAESDLILPWI